MLIYCVFSATISSPMFLIGHYLNLFQYSISLCKISTINYLTINIGMITSLAYASIERHFLIFHKNGLLSWSRQLLPIVSILIYSYIMAIFFTLIPTCVYFQCMACYTASLLYMIPWLLISFFLPHLAMIVSTFYLLVRLHQQRIVSNRRLKWSALKKIIIQISIYIIWSCLYYCPVSFYHISAIINSAYFSSHTNAVMDILSQLVLHIYPILTYISMLLYTRRKLLKHKRQSRLKLNNITTITTPPNDPYS